MAANHKTNLMSLPNELLLDIIDWLHVLNASDVITANKREKVKGGITKKAMMAEKQRLKNGLSVLNLSQVNRRLYHLALPEFLGKSTWRFVTQRESPPALRLHLMNGDTVLPHAINLGMPPPLDGPRSYLSFIRRLELTPYDLDLLLSKKPLWQTKQNEPEEERNLVASLATMTGILGVCTHLTIACPGVQSPTMGSIATRKEQWFAFGHPLHANFRAWFSLFGFARGQNGTPLIHTKSQTRTDQEISFLLDLMPSLRKTELRRIDPMPSNQQMDNSFWLQELAKQHYKQRPPVMKTPSHLLVLIGDVDSPYWQALPVELGTIAEILEKREAWYMQKIREAIKERRAAEDHTDRVDNAQRYMSLLETPGYTRACAPYTTYELANANRDQRDLEGWLRFLKFWTVSKTQAVPGAWPKESK